MQALCLSLVIAPLLWTGCSATTLYYRPLRQSYYKPARDAACNLSLVESIPENLTYPNSTAPKHLSTYAAYRFLVGSAVTELKVASLYWSLRGQDIMQNPGNLAAEGEELLAALVKRSQQLPVRIVNNIGGLAFNHSDLQLLARQPKVSIAWLNVTGLLGSGVQHAKLMLADGQHGYVGSSNIDWRSLTQVKELGLLMTGCPSLVRELDKSFEAFWLTASENQVPHSWPENLTASINASHPLVTSIGDYKYSIYLGISPAPLTPPRWSRDIDAIVSAILSARSYVHVAVMDYEAELSDGHSHSYWGNIDNALRTAAFNGVKVRFLLSYWKHSNKFNELFLKSLTVLNTSSTFIEGKFFKVPIYTKEQRSIPYARVNHNKYMVTEDTAVICTSNWQGSYFTYTTGVAASITVLSESVSGFQHQQPQPSIVKQLQDVFWRDWTSEYAHDRVPKM
uniref:PLD phosphodiesterase domain-containing protein n=1 Tax=Macrostomum lignano TaxID=282301 RepID=A0A1I8GLZ3_9PLAT